MKMLSLFRAGLVLLFIIAIAGCSRVTDNPAAPGETVNTSIEADFEKNSTTNLAKRGFVHGIVVTVDGDDYYFAGPPDGPNGSRDIPGHYWVQAGPTMLVGKHYNTGPFGASKWWSSDAPDGEYLYKVHAIIDTWTLA
ncbi:hypothetical protein GF337_13345, partial [candidate division KSB1 bacterium]|nr:hypothetical protein [candidate division KSB1 bacterium]